MPQPKVAAAAAPAPPKRICGPLGKPTPGPPACALSQPGRCRPPPTAAAAASRIDVDDAAPIAARASAALFATFFHSAARALVSPIAVVRLAAPLVPPVARVTRLALALSIA